MGLLDKLLGRTDDRKPKDENMNVPSIVSRAIAERDYNLNKAIKIPYTEAALTGGSLMQLVPSLKTLMSGSRVGNGSMVRVVFPSGVKGNLAVDKTGLALGGILKDGGGLAQARLVAIDPVALATQAAMAGILMGINLKLNNIQNTQKSIMGFLEQEKQAEQQGNLNIMNSILEGYQHNWDNELYLNNHHMKVLDIKQNAEKNIIFYQEQIAAEIRKLPAVYLDQMIKGTVSSLSRLFCDYRMSLYLFSFASFLEVMLLRNYKEAYLEQVASNVERYNQKYKTQFTECRDWLKKTSAASVETMVVDGIGNAGRTLGKVLGSVPILAHGPVDEWLQQSSEWLLKENDIKNERAMTLFGTTNTTGSEVFVENIRDVKKISNQITDILFDEEAIYLVAA